MEPGVSFSVFTKPWKHLTVSQLGKLIHGFGFDGIEFPLRMGYQVEPENAEKGLPLLADQLAEYGLQIFSVASDTDERIFAGCAAAGVKLIRIMISIDEGDGYMVSVNKAQQRVEKLLPLCEKYGVKVGIQQHSWNSIAHSAGLLRFVEKFNPAHIGAVWDAAHDALAGQQPEFGLDIVWSHLMMVNLKNACYVRKNGPEAETAEWERSFTTGQRGMASWPRAIDYLKKRGYRGTICLHAEYDEEHLVEKYVEQDLAYAKKLLSKPQWN